MEKIVSIIIPCYNTSNTLKRCLDSVLNQTYQKLEVIAVNDGSTDDTEKILKEYEAKFKENNMTYIHILQENKGLAGAINGGLKVFSGDYLCWIDSDDFLFDDSVKMRVEFLEKNLDIAVVTSDANFYNYDDLSTPVQKASDGKTDLYNPYQFENHLRSKAIFCCGCHMVRSSSFLDVIPSRKIYEARRGQNWQMLLPVYYKYKQAFLNIPLYAYILYPNSMSSGDITAEQYLKRYSEYYDIISNTLIDINMSDKERKKYMNIYKGLYARQKYYVAFSEHDYISILKNIYYMIIYRDFKLSDVKWMLNVLQHKN